MKLFFIWWIGSKAHFCTASIHISAVKPYVPPDKLSNIYKIYCTYHSKTTITTLKGHNKIPIDKERRFFLLFRNHRPLAGFGSPRIAPDGLEQRRVPLHGRMESIGISLEPRTCLPLGNSPVHSSPTYVPVQDKIVFLWTKRRGIYWLDKGKSNHRRIHPYPYPYPYPYGIVCFCMFRLALRKGGTTTVSSFVCEQQCRNELPSDRPRCTVL